MAHVMKMTRGAVGHMFKHYERACDQDGNYIKFGNEDIDIKRTALNYNLAPHRDSQGQFIKKRCSEVNCLNRKDVNVACSWVVTLPRDFKELNPDREIKEFFEGTYEFLEKRYGKENTISAYVHLDETTPHIHFCFIPVIKDQKKNQLKVSAKEVVNKFDLQTFHENLKKSLEQTRGLNANILNQATIEGNKSINELKRETSTKKLVQALEEVKTVQKHIILLEETKSILESKIKTLEGRILNKDEVNQVKIVKPLIGSKKAIIKMPYEDVINLKATAQRIAEIDRLTKEVEIRLSNVEKIKNEADKVMNEARLIPERERKERIELQVQLSVAKDRANKVLADVNKALDKCPKEVSQAFLTAYKEVGQEQRQRSHDWDHER